MLEPTAPSGTQQSPGPQEIEAAGGPSLGLEQLASASQELLGLAEAPGQIGDQSGWQPWLFCNPEKGRAATDDPSPLRNSPCQVPLSEVHRVPPSFLPSPDGGE